MIDVATWGGAQWLLAGWLFLTLTLFPFLGAMLKKRSRVEFAEWYLGKWIDAGILAAVLAWGGFWA